MKLRFAAIFFALCSSIWTQAQSVPPTETNDRAEFIENFEGWTDEGTEGDLHMYSRKAAGSEILEIAGENIIDGSLEKVASIIFNSKRSHEWMDDLDKTLFIRKTGPNTSISYNRCKLGIFRKRDFLIETEARYFPTKHALMLASKSHPYSDLEFKDLPPDVLNEIRPGDQAIRGEMKSKLILVEIAGGARTIVRSIVHADPMGKLPTFGVNMMRKKIPRHFFEGLLKQSKKNDLTVEPDIKALVATGSWKFEPKPVTPAEPDLGTQTIAQKTSER
jgi:hypothetical protein